MRHIRFVIAAVLICMLACLLGAISVFAAGSTPVPTLGESEKQARECEETQAFLTAIPLRMVFPEGELKTYVIDPQSGETLRRFNGSLQEYRPELDVVLTVGERPFYYVDGKETDTLPEKYIGSKLRAFPKVAMSLWKLSTGEKIGELRVVESIDNIRLKIVNDKVLLWNPQTKKTDVMDMANGEILEPLPGSFAFSEAEDSKTTLLILWHEDQIALYDPETLRQKFTLPGDDFELSDDRSRIVTWSDALQDASVFELSAGKRINSFPKGRTMTLNRDGTKLLTRDISRREIALWDVDSGQQLWTAPFGGADSDGYTFEFSDDDRIITGDCDLALPISSDDFPQTFVWNGWNGKEIAVFEFFYMRQYISAANRMFGDVKTGPWESEAALCDAVTGEKTADGFIGCFEAASRDGKTFLTSVDGMLFLWDGETGNLIRSFRDENVVSYESEIEFDSNPSLVKTTTPVWRLDSPFATQVTILDIERGSVVPHDETSPQTRHGDIVWKADEENAVFWNLATGEVFLNIRCLPPEDEDRFAPNVIGQIHFTPDGRLIFSIEMAPWHSRVIF